ncbi:MAG: transporter ATP-binding protein [Pseudomonadota bacterium]|jgi:ATP-binding cassette subfamily F protein 3
MSEKISIRTATSIHKHSRRIAPVIHLRNIRLRRGPEPLLDSATASILRGEKVGIVGRNGSGKSSLLALIKGELTPDQGDLEIPGGLTFASVIQELPDSDRAVIEHVIDGDIALRRCEQILAEAERREDGIQHAQALADFDQLGGYTARSRAAALLDGLGFDPKRIDQPIKEFSGGLRMRANLAKALMCPSDVLLLDEPTNHLDLDAVLWLERWLQSYPGTLMLVSHDRDFLDAVINRVLHVSLGSLTAYSGNFSEFETQRAARLAQQQAQNEKIRREAEHVRSFVERFRAKASKARQAQSRLKWLERLPTLVTQRVEHTFDWQFLEPRKLPVPLVSLDRITAGYGEQIIINDFSLSIPPGARIGILGRNGAGKSTLIKSIAGQLAPLGGTITSAPDLEVGFFAQLEVDQLDASSTAILELTRRGGAVVAQWPEQQKRDHLGSFGFQGDRVFESVKHFSGGERARLSLAILVARRPNLLLLDEPTNHLDLEMRDSLLLALQEFSGAVILVSHDRGLLGSVCDEFWLVRDGAATRFDGDLQDYAQSLARDVRSGTSSPARRSDDVVDRREQRRRDAAARQQLASLRTELKTVEKDLERLSAQRRELEQQMLDAASSNSSDPAMRTVPQRLGVLVKQIETLEERWLELGAELEAAASSD